MDKKILVRDHTEKKDFSYQKGEVHISFQLRIDVKQQLKDAREILLAAIEDFDEELKKL